MTLLITSVSATNSCFIMDFLVEVFVLRLRTENLAFLHYNSSGSKLIRIQVPNIGRMPIVGAFV